MGTVYAAPKRVFVYFFSLEL